MPTQYSNDPLHGLSLKMILTALVDKFGWKVLSRKIEIRCFYNDPSMKSSLKFLRKTDWARKQVEELFIKECSDFYTTPEDVPFKKRVEDESKDEPKKELTWIERREQRNREK